MTRVLRFAILILIFLAILPPAAIGQKYFFKNFTPEHGLPQSQVLDICQDTFGHLWVGTASGGIGRFDGKNFKTYTVEDGLLHNTVFKIGTNLQGNVVCLTRRGISVFDGTNFHNYPTQFDIEFNYTFESIQAIAAFDPNAGMFFKMKNGGLGIFNNGEIKYLTPPAQGTLTCIAIDTKGDLWVAAKGEGIFRFNNSSFELVEGIDKDRSIGAMLFNAHNLSDKHDLPNKHDLSNKQDSSNKPDTSNAHHSPNTHELPNAHDSPNTHELPNTHNLYTAADLFPNDITGLVNTPQGTRWIIHDMQLYRYKDSLLTKFTRQNGLTDLAIYRVFVDRDGSLWIGTNGEGLYEFRGDQFKYFDRSTGLHYDITSAIVKDKDNNFWIGFPGAGIDVVRNNEVLRSYNRDNGFVANYINCGTADKNGNLWFGTYETGVVRFKNNQYSIFSVGEGLPDKWVTSVFAAPSGELYVGTNNGLAIIDTNDRVRAFKHDSSALIIGSVLKTTSNDVYVGTKSGLYKFSNEKFEHAPIPSNQTGDIITFITEDDQGNIWYGIMGKGICRFNPHTNTTLYLSEETGLLSNQVYSGIIHKNVLVTGTGKGVSRIDLRGDNPSITNFGREDGFEGLEARQATTIDENGVVWLSSIRGVYGFIDPVGFNDPVGSIDPVASSVASTPKPFLRELTLLNKETSIVPYADSVSSWFSIPVGLKLKNDLNYLNFRMGSVNLRNPEKIYYKYRLETLDKDWSPVTTQDEVRYHQLPPGEYKFVFTSSYDQKTWSSEEHSLSFVILPPFYRTWWFTITAGLTILACLFVIHRIRLRSQLNYFAAIEAAKRDESEKIRKRLAMDFHDELGNHLATLTSHSRLLGMKLKDQPDAIRSLISKIEKNALDLFGGTKDFIWSIDPSRDSVSETAFYLRDFGEDLFAGSGMSFYFDFDESIGDDKLPAWVNRQIVLILKEGMANVLKHSRANNVRLTCKSSKEDPSIVIGIEDDGIGMPLNGQTPGNGLNNIRNRAKKIDAAIRFETNEPLGTRLVLTVHLEHQKMKV